MNSSARGPFLPSYWPDALHWTQPFVSRLRGLVKLVGPTISCEGELAVAMRLCFKVPTMVKTRPRVLLAPPCAERQGMVRSLA